MEYKVSESTVFGIIHSEEKLRQEYAQRQANGKTLTTKSLKHSDWPELDLALKIWFFQEREIGTPISGPMIATQALIFHSKIKARLMSDWKIEFINANFESIKKVCKEEEIYMIKEENPRELVRVWYDKFKDNNQKRINDELIKKYRMISKEFKASAGFISNFKKKT